MVQKVNLGIEIEELANKHTYLEICYLLLNSNLPNELELKEFDLELRHRSLVHENVRHLFPAFPAGAHPMARRIIAKIPTLAAFAFRHSIGAPFIHPDIDRSYTEIKALDTIFTLHADHEQNASTTTV